MTEHSLTLTPSRSTAIVGDTDAKMRAFDQIAANIASLQLNGWDNVQKAKAACWLADAKGEHPAEFMESHFCMVIQGRLTVEPKWDYVVRKLRDTVPNFTFKVLREDDNGATVEMSDGGEPIVVTYTMDDAVRQKLAGPGGRNAATWAANSREMCFKQAVKRAARRIGLGRKGPIPWMDVEPGDEPEAAPTRSTAAVLDEAIDEALDKVATVASPQEMDARPE